MRKTKRLDEILKRRGWVTDEQIHQGLRHQQRAGRRWGSTLVELGIITETQLAEALAEQYGTPTWDPMHVLPDPAALKLVPGKWAQKRKMTPISLDPQTKTLKVAMSDPTNVVIADEIRFQTGVKQLIILTAPEVSLARLWHQFYGIAPDKWSGVPQRLELEFGFKAEAEAAQLAHGGDGRPAAKVLLWLSQPFVSKLLRSLLEFERCHVGQWDGRVVPEEQYDYLVYDEDNALCHPDSLTKLKRQMPRLQLVSRPSWTTSLLRSPLSYERLRDGYVMLSEMSRRWAGVPNAGDGREASRYALAMARLLPLTPFEVDSLSVACELIPAIYAYAPTTPERETLARELACPYPVAEIIRSCSQRFDEMGVSAGQSTPEAPFAGRVYFVVDAFMRAQKKHLVNSIEDAGQLSEMMRQDAGKLYDPMAVEALLRVVREEVLEGYLPPGPAEAMLVADRPVEWTHLSLLLENEGWRIVVAGGASEARTLTARRKPDAVVWAASGAIEWIRWQSQSAPGIANFVILEEFDSALARSALESGYEDVWAGNWDAGVAAAKLRRIIQRRPQGNVKTLAVTGSLDQLSFIDMVQILAAGTRSVKIELTRGPASARVVMWQGQIKFAESGDKKGENAVYEILSWHDATFAFSPVEEPPQPNCRMTNEAMLMEGCRLLDEHKRDVDSGKVAVLPAVAATA